MGASIELENLPRTDRIDFLRTHMRHGPVPLELVPNESAQIQVKSSIADFGGVHLLSTRASGGAVVRTPRLARDDTEPSLIISLLRAGSTLVSQDGRDAHLRPGDMAAMVTSRPYRTTFELGTAKHSFQIPLHLFGLPPSITDVFLAIPIGPGNALASVVSGHLQSLVRAATSLTPHQLIAMERPTVDLVAAMFATNAEDRSRSKGPLAQTLGLRIVDYMRQHLTDAALSPSVIASAHGISQRYLYLILSRMEISPREWIREQRIIAAAESLCVASAADLTIAELAYRWGFADHAHFTRVFRRIKGVTPSEWRRMHSLPIGVTE